MRRPPPPTSEESDGLSRGLDRVLRAALLLVPFGVLGNLALSWFATDHDVLRALGRLDLRYLWLALALALAPWFTNALRLQLWASFIGHPLGFREMFRVTLGSELSSSVVPTSSGGEVFRWGMMVQKGIPKGKAASIVTLGYLEDTLFFVTAIPVAIVWSRAWELPVLRTLAGPVQDRAILVAFAGAGVVLTAWVLVRAALLGGLGDGPRRRGLRASARLRRRFRRSWHDFRTVYALVGKRGKRLLLLTFLIASVQWICRYSVATAVAFLLGAPVDPVLFFLLQWVIFTAMNFVPTPGASGGAEAAFFVVYQALLPAGLIGIATALWRMLTFYVQLALGAVIFLALNVADARTRARHGGATG